MDDILAYFWRLWTFFKTFLLFPSQKTIDHDMLVVNFKYGKDKDNIRVSIQPTWTVRDIKVAIVEKINKASKDGLTTEDISIIFAGKELPDELPVSVCDVSNESVVHVVRLKKKKSTDKSNDLSVLVGSVLTIRDENGAYNHDDTEENGSSTSRAKSFFTVYCSNCKILCPGKIRVRCSSCQQKTLILSRDPQSWMDVLQSRKIPGTCLSDSCEGGFADFYFKCASGNHQVSDNDDSHVTVPLHQIKTNMRKTSCLSCTEVSDQVFVFNCAEKHVICLDCFKNYCLSRLNDRQFILNEDFGYTLGCPIGCRGSLISVTHHFHIMGKDAYSKYQTFAAEEYTLKSGGVFCPRPDCGSGIIIEGSDPCSRVTCGSCSFVFCRRCLRGYHLGDCSMLSNKEATTSNFFLPGSNSKWEGDVESDSTIMSTTKPCPQCRTPTERSGGCMHMICTRAGCGFEWCWVCQTEWTRECMANHWFD